MSASPSGAVAASARQPVVGGSHHRLHVRAGGARAAAQAHDDVETAVKIDDGAAAGALVQAVDVLRHEREQRPQGFPGGERMMRRAGSGAREARPPGVRARPVAPVYRLVASETPGS